MIPLPNNCRYSKFHVYPANWLTAKAKLDVIWYADSRFIDPRFMDEYPKGKPIRLKGGVNLLNSVKERREGLQLLIDETIKLLESGYNPITDNEVIAPPPINSSIIPKRIFPSTPFIVAFKFALSKSNNVKETIADTNSVINSMEIAAKTLGYFMLAIKDVQIMHIKQCLDECVANPDSRFSAKRFNKAKAYLSGLFKYLVEIGCSSGNMAKAISPMKEPASFKVYFTDQQIADIKEHLWNYNRPFLKFVMIFYYSGGRLKELFRLKKEYVDLINQTYTTLVKKGGKERWVPRTIRNVALPYWKEQMENCKPNDYVFSKDLLPGPTMINSKQVTRRWKTWVMDPLGINITIYKLKHRNTDRTVKALSVKIAAGQNAHTSTKMVEEVYAYNEQQRIHESLKELDIEF